MTLQERITELQKEAALIQQHMGDVKIEFTISAPCAEMKEYDDNFTFNTSGGYYFTWVDTTACNINIRSIERFKTQIVEINEMQPTT